VEHQPAGVSTRGDKPRPDERGTAFGIIGVEKVYVAGERRRATQVRWNYIIISMT
jgi:hypothetical protein